MKFIVLMLMAVCFVSFTSCGRIHGPVNESHALMEARDDMITHWSKSLKDNATAAGMDEARKYFESKKADIIAKRDAMNAAPQGFNSDWRTNLYLHEVRTGNELDTISGYLSHGTTDLSAKFDVLRKEFEAVYK